MIKMKDAERQHRSHADAGHIALCGENVERRALEITGRGIIRLGFNEGASGGNLSVQDLSGGRNDGAEGEAVEGRL